MSVKSAAFEGEDGMIVFLAVPQKSQSRLRRLAGFLNNRHDDNDLMPADTTVYKCEIY